MGEIIQPPAGAGGGDASANNQQKQIDELAEGSAYPSVFKDSGDTSAVLDFKGNSVFKDQSAKSVLKATDGNTAAIESVFYDSIDDSSVFKTANGENVFKESGDSLALWIKKIAYSNSPTTAQCVMLSNTTPAGIAADVETYLQSINSIPGQILSIINVQFQIDGVTHRAYITYNIGF